MTGKSTWACSRNTCVFFVLEPLRACWSPIPQQVERVKSESMRLIAESLINASELAGSPS